MTHILIPITEHLEEAIRTGNVEYLSELVFRGKQISLDEKDIEEKAKKAIAEQTNKIPIPTSMWITEIPKYEDCYKQALKDLL